MNEQKLWMPEEILSYNDEIKGLAKKVRDTGGDPETVVQALLQVKNDPEWVVKKAIKAFKKKLEGKVPTMTQGEDPTKKITGVDMYGNVETLEEQ